MGGSQSVVKQAFGRYLLLTNTVSCGMLMAGGDLVVQKFETRGERDGQIDWKRAGRLGTTGLMFGPLSHFWYAILDRRFPGVRVATILKKILGDQIIAAPVFAFTFFIGSGMLEGRTYKHSLDEFKGKFWTVYKADWMVWPAAQYLNFYLLPPHLRVVYVAAVTGCWDGYLSYVKHKKDDTTTSDTMRFDSSLTDNAQTVSEALSDSAHTVSEPLASNAQTVSEPLADNVQTHPLTFAVR